jgi:sigma-B regulation protein RsbU (phosphoserine phosphatase)
MFPDMQYPVMDVTLHPGDLVVSYTDGITEATDWQDVEFEETGLESIVRYCAGRPCEELISRVIRGVLAHVAGSASHKVFNPDDLDSGPQPGEIDAGDDLTMVVWRRKS